MSTQSRTVSLAAAETPTGIRVYTKDAGGAIRELYNDTSIKTLVEATNKDDRNTTSQSTGWFAGELAFPSGADSALCSFAWASWSQSVVYQDAQGALREQRHLNKWEATDFVQAGALPGTSVAAVHAPGAKRVVLFFQDKEGFICYRTATDLVWSKESVRLVKAALGTGIGATSWGNLDDIRIYYQDEEKVVREQRGGFDGKWSRTELSKQYQRVIGDITAVSWAGGHNTEIRLYIQEETGAITELCNNGGKDWPTGGFKVSALPKSDIIAFTRSDATGVCRALHVLWAGNDEQLWQRVIIPGQGWHEPTPIGSVRDTGKFAGSAVGDLFTDASMDAKTKRIARIRVRCGDVVDGLALDFTDGTSTAHHGGTGGSEQVFTLEPDEDVIRVTCVAGKEWVQALQFESSFGQTSPWYGLQKLPANSGWYDAAPVTHVWYDEGRALAGFLGCSKQYMKGLKAVWSDRMSCAGLATLGDLEKETTRLEGKLAGTQAQLAATKERTAAYKTALEGLRPLGAEAALGLGQLAESVEYLHDLSVAQQKARLRATPRRAEDAAKKHEVCKEETAALKARFAALAAALAKLRPTGDAIHDDLTQLSRDAHATENQVKNMTAWSGEYKTLTETSLKKTEHGIATMKENVARDQAAIKAAEEAEKKDAEPEAPKPTPKPARKYGFTDVAKDSSSDIHSNLVTDVADAKKALAVDAAQLAALEATHKETAAKLAGAQRVLGRLAALRTAVDAAILDIKGCVDESGKLLAQAAQYTSVLALVLAAFAPLEAAAAVLPAKVFAAVLAEVVRLVVSAEHLKELLKLSGDSLLATMQDVAAYKL